MTLDPESPAGAAVESDGNSGAVVGQHPGVDLAEWRQLWQQDRAFPIQGRPGILGRIAVAAKRLLRPFFKAPVADLWDRQRVFNQILLDHLAHRDAEISNLLEQSASESEWRLQEMRDQAVLVSRILRDGLQDVMNHNDALFSRVDQKLDRYRRRSRDLQHALSEALATTSGDPSNPSTAVLAESLRQTTYAGLAEDQGVDAGDLQVAAYLGKIPQDGPVLGFGCGNREVVRQFAEAELQLRWVDSNPTVVASWQEEGLAAEQGYPLQTLEKCEQDSLAAVISLHTIESMAMADLDRLVRLSYRALRSGGVVILETANPMSLVAGSRDFWRDPRRIRPVHPDTLEWLVREVGFGSIERLDFAPYSADQRLPEVPLDGLEGDLRSLAGQVNELRDRLDELLHGYQDYALICTKS